MTVDVINREDAQSVLSESDKEMDRRAKKAVSQAIERAQFLGRPVARYDETGAYLEFPDGSRQYEE